MYNTYCELSEEHSFMSFLETNLNQFSSSIKMIISKIDLLDKRRSCLNSTLYNNSMIKARLNNLGQDLNELNAVVSSFKIIKESFPTIANNQNLLEWVILYENTQKYINLIIDNLILTNDRKHLDELINDQKVKLDEDNRQITSCKSIINAISSLPTLEENMHDFMTENASRIEHIFKLIHKPMEFIDLKIEDGEISFIRKSTKEKTKQDEISTGQRISLMFAIMLCLYLSAQNAPQLILLDEPVANMDDMHIMNLIDILRELLLHGTQIFLTTANDQVASILRRKFSFFGRAFKHIRIERNDAGPSIITEINYQSNNEELNIIKIHA
jgi:DNA repair protein SbcC/Rad50